MSFQFPTDSSSLRNSTRFRNAKKEMLETILEASGRFSGVKPGSSSPEVRASYEKLVKEIGANRGRDLYYPFIGSGLGAGPLVELMDGSVKYDMITGIGINFFGHTHPALVEEMIDGLTADPLQGNLEPGYEMAELLKTILARVGQGSRLNHGWMMCSGTMSNEVALKIIRQKKFPATKDEGASAARARTADTSKVVKVAVATSLAVASSGSFPKEKAYTTPASGGKATTGTTTWKPSPRKPTARSAGEAVSAIRRIAMESCRPYAGHAQGGHR